MASRKNGKDKQMRYSCMKQPPLIKQLKEILSEYPDGGQIIKELIQNAEDAGAHTMKILYDDRRINHDEKETPEEYRPFFQGPALCVYNDAEFQDEDWDGIQMIYSSVKKEDRLKVGRFGLGFKSVFHITDFPSVLSGSQLLMIDPQQSQDKVNAMTDLKDLHEIDGIDIQDFFRAFEGTFGMSKKHIEQNHFPGTIFRFPLRDIHSDLSETLYFKQKVVALFEAFQKEASTILIFLKSLEKISLHICSDNSYTDVAIVQISDTNGSLNEERRRLKENLSKMTPDYSDDDIKSVCVMQIEISLNGQDQETQLWMVVNYYVGSSASETFRELIKDSKLGYSPFVGVAAQLMPNSDQFEGHIFCFLPLPREGVKLTGLPVHVNGFFALNQSRHHLKRPTTEQNKSTIDDKCLLWNQLLTEEALPAAYTVLIKSLISWSVKNGNAENHVQTVYNALPCTDVVVGDWKMLEGNLYMKLQTEAIVFSEIAQNWITVNEAWFATFTTLPLSTECDKFKTAVIKCLMKMKEMYVDVPINIVRTLTKHFAAVKNVSQKSLSQLLLKNDKYNELTRDEKLYLLEYFLFDGNDYHNVAGLQLLPLESGDFTVFQRCHSQVYMCTEEDMKLFHGLESQFLLKECYKRKFLAKNLDIICKKGLFQLQNVNLPIMKSLLQKTICNILHRETITYITEWLQHVWKTILQCYKVNDFEELQILPVPTSGIWPNPKAIDLVKLTDLLLVQSVDGKPVEHISDSVYNGLKLLNVEILAALPSWIPLKAVEEYVHVPTQSSILKLLSKIHSQGNMMELVTKFNNLFANKDEFVSFFVGSQNIGKNQGAKELLKLLKIFHVNTSRQGRGEYRTLTAMLYYMTEADMKQFPTTMSFPMPILTTVYSGEALLLELGVKKYSFEECILQTIQVLIKHQNIEETCIFMNYFIKNFHLFSRNENVIKLASNLPFLIVGSQFRKPAELFDPTDVVLKSLLADESLLPDTSLFVVNADNVHVLKLLGMKDINGITVNIVFQVAQTLHNWSILKKRDDKVLKKAWALLEILKKFPAYLNKYCQGYQTLKQCVFNLSCIAYTTTNKGTRYPDCIPWFPASEPLCRPSDAKNLKFCEIVGGTIPLVDDSSTEVSAIFEWNSSPPLPKVFEQLMLLSTSYHNIIKPDILTLIKSIYDHLNNRLNDVKLWNKDSLSNTNIIWHGDGFIAANNMVIHHAADDLELRPYIYSIPSEFSNMAQLFKVLGCTENQDSLVLIKTLETIRDRQSTSIHSSCSVSQHKQIVISILDRLAKLVQSEKLCLDDKDVLMLVREENPNILTLVPGSKCTYDDDPDFCEENESEAVRQFFVDHNISLTTAKALGVKSVNVRALLDTEGLGYEECGQDEPLTSRIHGLLTQGYTDGFSVPKELVQNADDAKATTVKFLYDERSNLNAHKRLLSQGMKDCQGQALWVYNDAKFTDQDFGNIRKLNGATKEKDFTTIGKFGLGFCSVYNLTDVPSFVSGKNIIIFDPHETYLEDVPMGKKSRGLKINMSNRDLMRRYVDQFRPYEGIFGCSMLDLNINEFNGTLFRLPLRTEKQAKGSKISQKVYSKDEVHDLFRIIVERAGNLLLFSQNVRKIELYHLKEGSELFQPQCLFRIEKRCFVLHNGEFQVLTTNVLAGIPNPIPYNLNIHEMHKIFIDQHIEKEAKRIIPGLSEYPEQSCSSWLISWSSGQARSLQMSIQLKTKAIPLTAISIPCTKEELCPMALSDVNHGFYKLGHAFCFMPLPVETKLNFHINGYFEVTYDRRQLLLLTEDDKCKNNSLWNEILQEDSLVQSHIHLLTTFTEMQKKNAHYNYYSLWPIECSRTFSPFRRMFFRTLLHENLRLFKGIDTWVSFDHVLFLDPIITSSTVGSIAFEFMAKYPPEPGKCIVEIPNMVIILLKECNPDQLSEIEKAVVTEEMLSLYFLKYIQDPYWNNAEEKRNRLLLYFLNTTNKNILSALRLTSCIPTEPNGKLCRPDELIDPKSELANLFLISDERFPQQLVEFKNTNTTLKLISLGMHDKYLSKDVLKERCDSLETVASKCISCTKNRIIAVMKYLSKTEIQHDLQQDKELLLHIQKSYFIPVSNHPNNWPFSWKADTCSLVRRYFNNISCDSHQADKMDTILLCMPTHLYRQNVMSLVGAVQNIADEALIAKDVYQRCFEILGIKGEEDITHTVVINQIMTIANDYHHPEKQYECAQSIFTTVYGFINQCLRFKSEEEFCSKDFASLANTPVILIGKELIKPCHVVFNIKYECPPHLFQVPKSEIGKKTVYKAIGVQDCFSIENIIAALQSKKEQWNDRKCDEVENISNMLKNLLDCLSNANKTYTDVLEHKESIVAPDVNGQLWPTYKLVIEDVILKSESAFKILHESVAPGIGKELGVKSKKQKVVKCFSSLISFGQKEKLVTRLNGILKDYPCDSSIMKELLQNADDANATEIHFIKDFRTRVTSDNAFESGKLQGPSLCIFNNSYFTDNDFEGIHYLGEGSKRGDPTKTGQYGVGFNAVYHLTDVPSFITKGPGLGHEGTLCMFDPLLKYIEDYITETEPGIKCDVEKMKMNFPEVMNGHLQDTNLFNSGKGTLFRLPLRQKKSELGKHVSSEDLEKIVNTFKEDMSETLLFVKNVTTIKVSTIINDRLIEEYSVCTYLTPEDEKKRSDFFTEIKKLCNSNSFVEPREVGYTMTLKDSKGMCSEWYIVQRYGFHADAVSAEVNFAISEGELNQMPIGGVAVPLLQIDLDFLKHQTPLVKNILVSANVGDSCVEKKAQKQFIGKVFCFLPLPEFTGIPVHINGHFNLDRARRRLWIGGDRQIWNELLLKENVSFAWISAMKYLRHYIFACNMHIISNWTEINHLTSCYYMCFPNMSKCEETFQELGKAFYTHAMQNEEFIFPVVTKLHTRQHIHELREFVETKFEIEWVPFTLSVKSLRGVFNDIYKQMEPIRQLQRIITVPDKHQDECKIIERTLKRLGLKIIQYHSSIYHIQQALKDLKFDVFTSSPDFTVQFLKSWDSDDVYPCSIGNIGVLLEKTNLKDLTSLSCLLNYIKLNKQLPENLIGLPLCLKNDGVLQAFSKEKPVFCSKFASMLPNSASLFIHTKLVHVLSGIKCDVLKDFQLQDLLKLLPDSYDTSTFALGNHVPWNKENGEPVTQIFVQQFFEFLYDNTYPLTMFRIGVDQKNFSTNAQLFKHWSFLPSCKIVGNDTHYELVPICHSFHLFYCSSSYKAIEEILKTLNFAMLDEQVFEKMNNICYAVKNLLASTVNAVDFLKCLNFYKGKIQSAKLQFKDGMTLLAYFDGHIPDLIPENVDENKRLLKALPLFPSKNQSLINIDGARDTIVLPAGMPANGIEQFANSTELTMLQDTSTLERLYTFLGLKKMKIINVYIQLILPKFENLPEDAWLEHIKYIKEELFESNCHNNDSTQALICLLKNIPFVQTGTTHRTVNEFYCDDNVVFKCMLDQECFLPESYKDISWRHFLEALGLNVCVTDELMIQFASQIEKEGLNSISEKTAYSSQILTRELLNGTWKESTLQTIKFKRFVLPYKVDEQRQNVFRQWEGDRLLCFNGSVSKQYMNVCWTSVCMLNLEPPQQCTANALGILDVPALDKLVLHAQNVCDSFKTLLQDHNVNEEFVQSTMENIYTILKDHINETGVLQQRLYHTPFIYLPDDCVMISANSIVIGLSSDAEVKPYLYAAPDYYGKFHDLFKVVGCSKEASISHYAAVLEIMKNMFKDGELPPNSLEHVRKCLSNIVHIIMNKNDQTLNSGKILYLPNRKNVLAPSTDLVVSNNDEMERRIGTKVNLDFFIGLKEMDIVTVSDPKTFVKKLPQQVQPMMLTEIISEEIVTTKLTAVESKHASRIEDFVLCTEMLQGVLRLVKHQKELLNEDFTSKLESLISLTLSYVKIRKVTGLYTYLSMHGQIIEGSEQKKTCFIKTEKCQENEEMEIYILHFQSDEDHEKDILSTIIHADNGLIDLIDKCTQGVLEKETYKHLTPMLSLIDNPESIKAHLDNLNINAYDLPQRFVVSAFPKPGTYVQQKFHPFLEEGISPFKEHEFRFVAFELEDDIDNYNDDDGNEPIYIYAHIIGEVKRYESDSVVKYRYSIDIGERGGREPIIVPISRLYRFICRDNDTGRNLIKYDNEPTDSLPFDENCRRVCSMLSEAWQLENTDKRRTVKRLLMKWHPDKNIGNIDYCTRVFNYIQAVIVQLENGEAVEQHITEQTGRSAPDLSRSSYYHMSANICSRGHIYARAFHDNFDIYNRSQRTGIYSHSNSSHCIVRDVQEATRWLRQAQHDYKAAVACLPSAKDIKAYNWVCIECQQSSEKALKAACFATNANKFETTHHLLDIAHHLGDNNILEEVQLLELQLGPYTRMRYPNAVDRSVIPADVYNKNHAEKALSITKRILKLVSDFIESS